MVKKYTGVIFGQIMKQNVPTIFTHSKFYKNI